MVMNDFQSIFGLEINQNNIFIFLIFFYIITLKRSNNIKN
jgi:hypothetical protein